MNILLIKPKWFFQGGAYKFPALQRIAPLNLGILAALSQGHSVRIVDEDVEDIPKGLSPDLVGITAATFTAPRAYRLAEEFRRRGSRVVMGGVHPSLLPEECLKFCDAVVVGEAEYVWPRLLDDLKRGRLQPIYKSDAPTNMDDVPFPRRDLFLKKYVFEAVQATRGCVNSCGFCYLNEVPWGSYRLRKSSSVCEELQGIKSRYIFFVDDNLFINADYVSELMERMCKFKMLWTAQAPVSIAKNDKLLKKMADAGCFGLALGFQSISQNSLDHMRVKQKADEYRDIVDKLHGYGILVTGFFVLGFDFDTEESLGEMFRVVRHIDLDDALFYILTPYPGTKLFCDLERDNRILSRDLSRYSWNNCVFRPKNIEPRRLETILREGYRDMGRFQQKTLLRKLARNWRWSVRSPRFAFHLVRGTLTGVDISKLP